MVHPEEEHTAVEHMSYNFATTPDSLRRQERRLAVLGPRDDRATAVFRDYCLPGQGFTRELEGGKRINIVRGLVDPEEYAIAISEDSLPALLEIAHQDQLAVETYYREKEMQGEPPLYTSLEIIIGSIDVPEACYRYKVLKIITTDDPLKVRVIVEQNIEHEKEKGAFMPLQAGGQDMGQNLQKTISHSDTAILPAVIVGANEFDDTQRELILRDDLPSGLAFGRRTGNLLAHQRAPQGMTRFTDDVAELEIDMDKIGLWVVAVSGDAVERNLRTINQ